MLRSLLFLGCLVAGPVLAQEAAVTTQTYRCDRGAQVLATHLNLGDRSFAVVAFEGRQLGFEIDISASGARYVAREGAEPFVWWTKGEEAMLLHGQGDAETMLYSACMAVPPQS